MKKLKIPEPFSGGIFLTYKCTNECKHCMYACSPKWKEDWINLKDAENVLASITEKIKKKYPKGFRTIGVNYGIHFTGGEPFLNFDLLLRLVKIAKELDIPSIFVETNCFWCISDEVTEDKLMKLKDNGLDGMLISANPFVIEQVPFERIERCVEISKKIFGENVIVYQDLFYEQFKKIKIKRTLKFEDYLDKMVNIDPYLLHYSLSYPSILPMGRACYKLANIYRKYEAKEFFNESCKEEVTRDWHVHVDNYFNYITGYCAGISLGDARDLNSICEGIDLDSLPIINALVSENGIKRLYELAVKYGYKGREGGYISKCHLCLDIRRYFVKKGYEFKELKPVEFYKYLE